MTITEALSLNGLWVRLLLAGDVDFPPYAVSGRVLGVVVPCSGGPLVPQIFLHTGGKVLASGDGLEVWCEHVIRVLYSGDKPSEPTPPALSLVVGG